MGRGIKIVARKKLSSEFNGLRRRLDHALRRVFISIKKDWYKFLEESTWENPRPVPRHQIIAHIHPNGRSGHLGWINYSGSTAAAEARFRLRQEPFLLKIPAHVEAGIKKLRGA